MLRRYTLTRQHLFVALQRLAFAIFLMYLTLFLCQRWLLYPAYQANLLLGDLQPATAYGLNDFRTETFTSADGVSLTAWYHPAPDSAHPTLLYLHGNAMHLAARAPRYQRLAHEGYGVLALSWRGYGTSDGSPSEEGLYEDARAALAFLEAQGVPISHVIVIGESLGTGVAIQMATEYSLRGLVLLAPYTSIATRAGEIYWWLPGVAWLARDRFDSYLKAPHISCPVLILHGEDDTVIPVEHSKQLAARFSAPPRMVLLPNVGHDIASDDTLLHEMTLFFTPAHP